MQAMVQARGPHHGAGRGRDVEGKPPPRQLKKSPPVPKHQQADLGILLSQRKGVLEICGLAAEPQASSKREKDACRCKLLCRSRKISGAMYGLVPVMPAHARHPPIAGPGQNRCATSTWPGCGGHVPRASCCPGLQLEQRRGQLALVHIACCCCWQGQKLEPH